MPDENMNTFDKVIHSEDSDLLKGGTTDRAEIQKLQNAVRQQKETRRPLTGQQSQNQSIGSNDKPEERNGTR